MTRQDALKAPRKVFLPYQQRLLAGVSQHAVVVVEKSRRTGYSWAAAAVAVLHAAADASAGGMDVFYMGYNLEMAREFIDYCAEWAEKIQKLAVHVEETVFEDPDSPERGVQAFRITFASGFKVVALPSKARALRGMQGLVILDEAAFHDELDQVLKAAFALLIWGGKVLVISTHDGEDNPFNELIQEIRAGKRPYELQRCDFDQALADGLYRRICAVKGETWTPEKEQAWRDEIVAFYGDNAEEELFCVPSKGGGSWLSLSTIEAAAQAGNAIPVLRWSCKDSFAELPEHLRQAECQDWLEANVAPLLRELDPDVPCFAGDDFGRSIDLSVLWPLQLLADQTRRPPFVVELRNVPFEQQRQITFYVLDRLPRFSGAAFDAGGNGSYLAEVAWQRYGSGRIEKVKFTEDWYRENMPPYKAAMQDGEILLPKDRDIINDHRAIQLERGVAKVPARRTSGTDRGQRHGDAAIASVLAHYATRMKPVAYGYTPAPRPRPLDEPADGGRGMTLGPPPDEDDEWGGGFKSRGTW